MIEEENLEEEETRKFLENSFRNGQVNTNGTDIEKILPPMKRFGGGNRKERKETIIQKIKKFFEKYFGVIDTNQDEDSFKYEVLDDDSDEYLEMVAEDGEEYKTEE